MSFAAGQTEAERKAREDAAKQTNRRLKIAGAAAAAAVVTLAYIYRDKWLPTKKRGKLGVETPQQQRNRLEQESARRSQSNGIIVRPTYISSDRPLVSHQWIQSTNKTAYAIQHPDGALSTYRGENPSSPNSELIFTTGPRGVRDQDGCFTTVNDDGSIGTYFGAPGNRGDPVFQTNSIADVADKGKLKLVLQDDGRLILIGSNNEKLLLWVSPVAISFLPNGAVLRVGDFIQSDNHAFFAILQPDGTIQVFRGNNPLIKSPELVSKTGLLTGGPGKSQSYFLSMQPDGNVGIYLENTPSDTAAGPSAVGPMSVWSAGTQMANSLEGKQAVLRLTNDGVLQVEYRGLTIPPKQISERPSTRGGGWAGAGAIALRSASASHDVHRSVPSTVEQERQRHAVLAAAAASKHPEHHRGIGGGGGAIAGGSHSSAARTLAATAGGGARAGVTSTVTRPRGPSPADGTGTSAKRMARGPPTAIANIMRGSDGGGGGPNTSITTTRGPAFNPSDKSRALSAGMVSSRPATLANASRRPVGPSPIDK